MKTPRPFLTARWLNLAILTYRVDPAILRPLLPPGCSLDLFDGHALASIVAFDFSDTRVMGVRWPGFACFPEINLRFYVRHGDDHGVCFVREFVGLRTVATLARAIYNEPYRVAPLKSRVIDSAETIDVRHELRLEGRRHSIRVVAAKVPTRPEAGGIECFLKDQEWGFGTSRRGRLIRYRVRHPVWRVHAVQSFEMDWNWSAVYGPAWEPLQRIEPASVMLVEGSAVELHRSNSAGMPAG